MEVNTVGANTTCVSWEEVEVNTVGANTTCVSWEEVEVNTVGANTTCEEVEVNTVGANTTCLVRAITTLKYRDIMTYYDHRKLAVSQSIKVAMEQALLHIATYQVRHEKKFLKWHSNQLSLF